MCREVGFHRGLTVLLSFLAEILENRKPQEDGLLRKTLFNLTMSRTGKKSSSDGESTPQAPLVNESIRGSKSRFPKAGSRKESIDPKATDSQSQDKTPKTISLDLGKLLPDVIS